MRIVWVIKEAALVLLSSASGGLLLFVSLRELTRPPGVEYASLKGMVPITTSKAPWLLLIAVLLLALWFSARWNSSAVAATLRLGSYRIDALRASILFPDLDHGGNLRHQRLALCDEPRRECHRQGTLQKAALSETR